MPARQVQAAGNADKGNEDQSILKSVINIVLIVIACQALTKFIIPTRITPSASSPASFEGRAAPSDASTYLHTPEKVFPIWPTEEPIDISVYVSESISLPLLSSPEMASNLVFSEKNFHIDDWSEYRSVTVDLPLSPSVQNNGTLFAHVFLGLSGAVLDPSDPNYDSSKAWGFAKLLNNYLPKKKVVKTKKLIGGDGQDAEDGNATAVPDTAGKIVSYFHPNLTLDVVSNAGVIDLSSLPPPLRQHVMLELSGARDETGRNGWYYPVIFVNQFWQLKDHMVELNHTVKSLPLHINLAPISWWKFQMYSSLDFSFKQQAASPGLGGSTNTGAELEEFKRILVETNIFLLGTTFIVSILHTIFEMLAFKNDISHWRNKKDNVGISVRTILANVFMQTVIFLYLVDNSDGTSWMILAGQGFGIVLEAWKITRMVDVKIRHANGLIPYRIRFEDKHKLSNLEKETKEYDETAFKYLYYVAVPLLVGYAIYSVIYDTHKSWYSFVLTTLVGSVYAYGFLMMVPSLYINYRLKSVAHMPRKTMIYKLLNTFIDDLFAFTIKMPTLHRLATLRDDVIYFIALYQAWIYRVDYRRVNEFGQGGEDEEDEKEVEDEKEAEDEKEIEDEVKVEANASGAQPGGGKGKGKKRK